MKEFYIVCVWNTYYPSVGLGNIKLVTFSEKEAQDKKDELDQEHKVNGYGYDHVHIYHSSYLPWGEVTC